MSAPGTSFAQEHLLTSLRPGLAALARRGTIRSYAKSSVIINEGDEGLAVFVLLEGSVKVYADGEQGREIIYGTINSGDYFGEMSLDGGPRSASVMTLVPSVCSVVLRAAVREHMVDEPEFAFELVMQVIRRARQATEITRRMALMDVYGRLAALLQDHASSTQLTHQDIANRVGSSREMVSRLLKDLERGGYVELGVKRIEVKKKLPARW